MTTSPNSGCQSPGTAHIIGSLDELPWIDDPTAERKMIVAGYLASQNHSVPQIKATREALGHLAEGQEYRGKDNTLVMRLTENHPDYFERTQIRGTIYVEATEKLRSLFSDFAALDRSRHQTRTPDGREVVEELKSELALDWDEVETEKQLARERLKNRLGRTKALPEKGVEREEVQLEFATQMEYDIQHRQQCIKLQQAGEDYEEVKLWDRFTSYGRAAQPFGNFCAALENAALRRGYRRGTMVTIGTYPWLFESILDQHEALVGSTSSHKENIVSWIGRRLNCDGNPDNLLKIEITDRGVIHLHLLIFGYPPDQMPELDELRNYLGGKVIKEGTDNAEYSEIRWGARNQRWMIDGSPTNIARGETVPLRNYLDDGFAEMMEVASGEATPTDISQDGRDYWKLTIYWALNAHLWSCSPSLGGPSPLQNKHRVPDLGIGTEKFKLLPSWLREDVDASDSKSGRLRRWGDIRSQPG